MKHKHSAEKIIIQSESTANLLQDIAVDKQTGDKHSNGKEKVSLQTDEPVFIQLKSTTTSDKENPIFIQKSKTYQPITQEYLAYHYKQFPDISIEICGTVHRIREMNGFSFLILRTGRELIQCILDDNIVTVKLVTEGSSIQVTGLVHIDTNSRSGPEIRVSSIAVLSSPSIDLPFVLGKKKLDISLDTNLDHRSISLRHPEVRAVFRIQEGIAQSFREYFTQQSFVEIHTPKIVFSGAEGGANIFKLDYFGKEVYLAQSPQFYKQAMVGVYERVYEIGAVYRAEKHSTSRHLNEYIGLDIEMGFIDSFEDLLAYETGWLQHMTQHLASHYAMEIELLKVSLPDVSRGIPSITFHEAKKIAEKKLKKSLVEERDDLSPDEETAICKEILTNTGSEFVFITHYPTSKRPFYAMEDPNNKEATLSFDLLFRGLEVTTGGQRIHDYHDQVKKMELLGMNPALFTSYLQIHQAGMPPHGGFGAGLERITMKLLNLPNIRQASLYPRDMNRVIP